MVTATRWPSPSSRGQYRYTPYRPARRMRGVRRTDPPAGPLRSADGPYAPLAFAGRQSPVTVSWSRDASSTSTSGALPSASGFSRSSRCSAATFTRCTGTCESIANPAATAAA